MNDARPTLPASALLKEETGWLQLDIPELPPAFGILAVIVLVLLNGFFVATEFSLVAVRRSRIEQLVAEGHRTARAVKNALDHLDTYIAATQLGITMASLALGWIGEPALAHLIDPFLERVLPAEWAVAVSHAIAVALSFAAITALHIVFGELAPKGIALQRPEATSLLVVVPTTLFLRAFKPFIMLLNGVGNLVLRLLGFSLASGEGNVHTIEELRYLVRSSREAGLLGRAEEEMASHALTFGDLRARNFMVPRTEMVFVHDDISRDALLALAGREHHVRFPVSGANRDDVLGIVYLTDVLDWEFKHPGQDWRIIQTLRPALMVPETLKADDLMAQMRAARTHTAIAIDEFGGVAGLITLQDMLEKLVGEIPEIDEITQVNFEMLPDGTARVNGMMLLADLEERLGLDLQTSESDTVGGFVLEMLGKVPEIGEELTLSSYRLRVSVMDGPRVAELLLTKS